jgi:hypothetical protein
LYKNKNETIIDVFLRNFTLEKGAAKTALIHAPPSVAWICVEKEEQHAWIFAKNCVQETLTTHKKEKHIHACQKKGI